MASRTNPILGCGRPCVRPIGLGVLRASPRSFIILAVVTWALPALCIVADAESGQNPLYSPTHAELNAKENTTSAPQAKPASPVQLLQAYGDVLTVNWDVEQLRLRHQDRQPFVLGALPIRQDGQPQSKTRRIDLELKPFSMVGPNTRFVLGRSNGLDEPFPFDASSVSAFRGRVKNQVGSDVVLVFGDVQTSGYIDLGAGRGRFLLSSKDWNGVSLPPGLTTIFPAGGVRGYQPPVPLCGVERTTLSSDGVSMPETTVAFMGSEPTKGVRHVELAIDTDFDYFTLFGDRAAATEYLVQMYTQVSHLFLRDAKAHFELVFVRLWDDPDNPFGPQTSSRGRGGLMAGAGVTFDVAQLVSGSRSAEYGGLAFGGLCSGEIDSWIAYVRGSFPDPTIPSPYHYDIFVAAHELGHNAGAPHTHEAGIDNCDKPFSHPQRGTIMSYCQQTYSGLDANQDLYFHSDIAADMSRFFRNSSCTVDDCNLNNIADALDIQFGTSSDINLSGVPDECEDCNGNGVLDDLDIASKTSDDVNNNTIPDDCEPDCNGNGIPDVTDILNRTSSDWYGNGVPDSCETDCNGNGFSDFSEIQADMPKDVDRNAVLDECQDCDNDSITDHAALNGAHNLWIASGLSAAPLREFFATTGVLVKTSTSPVVSEGQDVVITPDGRILVSSAGTNQILAFDRNTMFIEEFVPPDKLGMTFPTGMLIMPDGGLLVASRDTDNVLAFDAITGTPIGVFVSAGSGGLLRPHGLTVGPNGNLFVTSDANEIIEYDGQDGSFVRVFIGALANGGLSQPRDLVFKRDGHLLVTSFATNQVIEYNGQTGEPLGSWAVLGFAVPGMTPENPWGIEIGPNGNVFVSRALVDVHDESSSHSDGTPLHLSNAQVFEYDVCNGNFLRVHIGGHDHGLTFPTGIAFMPGWDMDCNYSLLPDTCDITLGKSFDGNNNQVPDECEIDCNTNGQLDRLDIIPLGTSLDCNNNLSPDECDIAAGISSDCDGSGVPDECEPDCNGVVAIDGCGFDAGSVTDCNGNGQFDSCEIFEGQTADCDSNCIPDACDPDFDTDGTIDACDDDIDDDGVTNDLDRCDFTPLGEAVTTFGGPFGDTGGDCRVNLNDYSRFRICLSSSGPSGPSLSNACLSVFDFNSDQHIDLADFAGFTVIFTDPG